MPNASILVRVDALDRQGNRLASAEERVRVPEGGSAAVAAGSGSKGGSSAASSSADRPADSDSGVRKGGGFWSSPWPYLIGGIAIASAGTAVYFGTRPTAQVAVGQVGVKAK
jgi:hypothetical protein